MREATNPQFSFIKPTHSLFGFFTSLCDAYSNVTMPERGGIKDVVERLQKDASDRAAILERSLKRLEWEKAKEKEAKQAADEVGGCLVSWPIQRFESCVLVQSCWVLSDRLHHRSGGIRLEACTVSSAAGAAHACLPFGCAYRHRTTLPHHAATHDAHLASSSMWHQEV